MVRGLVRGTKSIAMREGAVGRVVFTACLLAWAVGASGAWGASPSKQGGKSFLDQERALAEQGNTWAKYELYKAYRDGTRGAELDLREADRWVGEIVRGVHVVTFRPKNDFQPRTPLEFIQKFNEHSSLRSDRDGIGGASFFRTRVHNGMLIGSFLTETPDKMEADIQSNPDLELLGTAAVTPAMFVMYENSQQESLSAGVAGARSAEGGLAAQLRQAETGNYWSKYAVWSAYHKGTGGVAKDPEKARKWLEELVKDAYLATFRPVKGFAPKTPREFLDQFDSASSLRSEPKSLGGASFFRTTAKDGVLIGSFLTAYPDKMREAVKNNPSLELISIEKVTPEMFIRHDASPQESLQ